jgi:hyaluronate lyase
MIRVQITRPPATRQYWRVIFIVAMWLGALAATADEFDTLRLRWRDMLTMGTNANPADPNYAGWISSIGSTAQTRWSTMNANVGRTNLWSDLDDLANDSGDITGTYERIKVMAMGHAVRGSILETNVALRAAIVDALDWMYANFYNESQSEYDNFFDWEIGTPLNLNDVTVLMYDDLTGTQIDNYMDAVNHFSPTPDLTGANRVWKASVVAVRGAIVKSSAKLASARDALNQVFPDVTAGDGFYSDGSFIFHDIFPYNGGYGAQLIETLGPLMQFLHDSSWEVTDPAQTNLFRWLYDSFEPFIYRGAMMQMVSGRYYTRRGDDHLDGHDVLAPILRIAQFAPPADAAAFKSMLKHWIQADTYRDFIETQPPPYNVWAQAVMDDSNVGARGELVRHFQFPHMDRVVHLRPGWGFGIAMSSKRIGNYESIRGENLRGWFTGEGMTYLYNDDLSHYSDGFWPTVNPYRLPGTTVDTQTRTNASNEGYLSPNEWVGGASIQNLYGVAGMHRNAAANPATPSVRKSWFMFDNEVVCL